MEWIEIKDNEYPLGEELLVLKVYNDHEFIDGGYNGKPFITPPCRQLDISLRKGCWERFGGIATHYCRIAEDPKKDR